jgi:Pyridoxamine 5'-phosphate oxidase
MPNRSPVTFLDARYSQEDAQPTRWPDAVAHLERAGLFWVSSVRTDGRPHVTPVVAVWMDGALYFSSGPGEQKSKNLAASRHCAVTAGCNTWNQGFDIVLHGEAVAVRDLPLLQQVADAFLAKYGDGWAFEVGDDGTFRSHGGSLVYQLIPVQGTGVRKEPFQPNPLDFTA